MKKIPKLELTAEQQAIVAAIRAEVERDKPGIIEEARRARAADDAMQVELRAVFSLLRAVRKEQGLSLAAVSTATGISKPALSRMENDPAPNVQLHTLQRIAAALGKELRISLGDAPVKKPALPSGQTAQRRRLTVRG